MTMHNDENKNLSPDQFKNINDVNIDMNKILIYSTQLGIYYNTWESNENIHAILDINNNSFCSMIKYLNPNLDDKSIKCIVLALYIHIYTSI
jgi:hypothetical protein